MSYGDLYFYQFCSCDCREKSPRAIGIKGGLYLDIKLYPALSFLMYLQAIPGLIVFFTFVGEGVSLPPTVQLDSGTFTGTLSGSTDRFLGVPYAKPPYVF